MINRTVSSQSVIRILLTGMLLHAFPLWAENGIPTLVSGQTVYVPVYSHILHGNLDDKGRPGEVLLSSMLSVRNTDASFPMVITSVKYIDNDGRLIREYLDSPRRLAAMGSADFFVEYKDRVGGAGANFVVTWTSERPINQPILETIQVYFWGAQAQSFTSRGQPIYIHQMDAGRDKAKP